MNFKLYFNMEKSVDKKKQAEDKREFKRLMKKDSVSIYLEYLYNILDSKKIRKLKSFTKILGIILA